MSNDVGNTTSNDQSLVGLGTDSKANEAIYNQWASSGTYEQDTRQWGYQLPEQAAQLIFKHASSSCSSSSSTLSILDAGAGDGLTGVALRNAGFVDADITGSDISQGMLQKAAERKCYSQTTVIDLNQPIDSFESNSLDVVNCIGTLTYIAPESGALAEFIRIVKPGGFVCYSNRTDKLELWKDTEAAVAEKWRLVEKMGPMPYLPDNPEFADKVNVVLYLYQVL